MKIIETTMSKVDDHYQMGLLWKMDNPSLPFNRAAAEVRLQHLKKRFSRDPNLESNYRAVINTYVDKGYARKLTPEETARKSRITWYLPHHPVFNVNKPNKFVWCSMQLQGIMVFPLTNSCIKGQISLTVLLVSLSVFARKKLPLLPT